MTEAESESFLDRVFGGALKPALAHFIKLHRLTPDDIEDLKKMLDKEGNR
ncbi:BlaI/MecI/CopY family transcriptional regulator [Paenibacillus sp. CECT 9249]|nr:BlaI/MecI/CopY family transcriptional regulator [Paenibacillus sp. CECT 9249]